MQYTVVTCFIILTITIAIVSCMEDKDVRTENGNDVRLEKRLGRRDPLVVIESRMRGQLQQPKVIYRRVSQSPRYGPPKSKYGVPRTNFKSPKPSKYPRKPGKKFRKNHRPKHVASKYLPPTKQVNKHKKRNSKPRYGPPEHIPVYEPVHSMKQPSYSHNAHEITGFGEPPVNYGNYYLPPKQTYGEPPVDSYGVPLKSNHDVEIRPTATQNFQETTQQFDNHNYYSHPPWSNKDAYIAYSNKHPSYSKPDEEQPFPEHHDEDEELDEFDTLKLKVKEKRYVNKNPNAQEYAMPINRPWRGRKKPQYNSEIVVGGQYAEPPARFVAPFNPSAPMLDDAEDPYIPYQSFIKHEIGSSARNSPYVNYKHSNMAFSPQNLNDAFSIVNK